MVPRKVLEYGDWKLVHQKCIVVNDKYHKLIIAYVKSHINGKQTLEDCQKSCAPNKKITCPRGARKICNANDPHCIDNSSKYC